MTACHFSCGVRLISNSESASQAHIFAISHLESASLARFVTNLETASLGVFWESENTFKNDFFVSITRQTKAIISSWGNRLAPKRGGRAPNPTE